MLTAARTSATMLRAPSVRPRATPRAAAASAPLGRVATTPLRSVVARAYGDRRAERRPGGWTNEFGDEYEDIDADDGYFERRPAPRRGGRFGDERGGYADRRRGGDDSRGGRDRGRGGRPRGGAGDDGEWIEESLPCAGKEPGRVIGKGGATINRIQDENGVRIDVLRDENRVVISGAPDAVRRAVSTVRIVMAEGDGPPGPWSDRGAAREVRRGDMGGDFVEETVPCTGLGPGRVIGKRGATVNRLQDETGARIEVRAEDGRCFVSGTSEQVKAAVVAVRRIMEEGDGYVPVGYDADGVFEGFDPSRARGGGAGAGAVEATVQFRSELEVGRVIGKGGATVRHIEDETGARIQVDKRLMECVVTGGPEEVRRAARMCERVAEEGFGGAVRVVPCTGAEGAVIGPGGQRVRRLANDTKARIDIEKVDEYESECVIRGSPVAVAAAADAVERIVEEEWRRNEGGFDRRDRGQAGFDRGQAGFDRGRDDSYYRDERAYYDDRDDGYYRDERGYYDEREEAGYRRDDRGGRGGGRGRGGSSGRGRGGPRRYADYE